MDHKETLVKLLGLKADASDDAIQNAAATFQQDVVNWKAQLEEEKETLQNSLTAAAEEKTAIEAERDAMMVSNKAMLAELVDGDLVTYSGVIENKDDIKEKLLNDRAGTITILKGIKISNKAEHAAPIHDPNKAGKPASAVTNSGAASGIESVSAENATKISNRARELSRTLKIPHQQAFIMATGEVLKGT